MSKTCRDLIPEVTVDPEVFANMDNFELVNNPTTFAKSLRLQFPKFSKGFSSSDFEEFVQDHVGVENLKSIGRLNFPNEWQMEVKSEDVREKLIRCGKTKIKNRSCWISPLSTSEIRGYVHWLPNSIPNKSVEDLLSEYGEVLFVENQKQNLWNGKVDADSRYYALYLRAGKSKEDLPHFTKIGKFDVLVTVRGRHPACFHCRESGHRKNECKKYKGKLHGFCQRSKSEKKRVKPRGKRYVPASKMPKEVKETDKTKDPPETEKAKGAAASSGTKKKAVNSKVSATKKVPVETEPLDEISQLKLKMNELLSETFSKLELKAKHPNSTTPENAAGAEEVEKKKRKKKKKNKKKTEVNQP